ncbi:MAG: transcription-repair coupling factor [Bacteroidales bacterium]|nr:transcription-repair coupling factor [Bacteroidales bacterium]
MKTPDIFQTIKTSPLFQELSQALENRKNTHLTGLFSSAVQIYASALFVESEQSMLFILPDKEQAAYVYNDLENLLNDGGLSADRKNVLFFPASYKRPYELDHIDNANVLTRAEVFLRLANSSKRFILVSFPEALAEKVSDKKHLKSKTFHFITGHEYSIDNLIEQFASFKFRRVDFVVEPGEFALRGGLLDIYAYSNEFPYRLEFFGDELESIREFDPESQLSKRKHHSVKLLPNVLDYDLIESRIAIFDLFPKSTSIWLEKKDLLADSFAASFEKAEQNFEALESPLKHLKPTELYLDKSAFLSKLEEFPVFQFGTTSNKNSTSEIKFEIEPQPHFNKQFELLADNLKEYRKKGYQNLILAESDKQLNRLQQIFTDSGLCNGNSESRLFEGVQIALQNGFIDHHLKLVCYTDHQIFDRYRRFKIRESFGGKEAFTLKEIYNLQKGDFVTHVDHGIGRYDGLQKIVNDGKEQEVIRLIYENDDLLYVNIHSLHRISKYSGKDGTPPKINKIGSPVWNKLKAKTKSRVKDIAKDLIKLYAERKLKAGFEFEPDTYMQTELEASFIYEDTPDQLKATNDVKADMEMLSPMDRLVCGDVGFGKTEIAIRAAFKAVADNKQVAILVPTTILAYQHYKTFSERLADFPARVEYISRFRSTKDVNVILKDLKEGKVDILIGTHKLVGKELEFKDLGLLIVDEEQKFGVAIKEKLKQFKVNVDTLMLSATPIPRTLQFSLMGARDLSIINTPPPNRQPVLTELTSFNEALIRDAIMYEVSRRGQVFFVHNRVQNIQEVAGLLQRYVPDVKIAIAHGQMEGRKLEKVMMGFMEGDYDVLLATKIIESGLDISNVNTIFINEAHHYGLSELHQLRGRVGRSNKKAFCYLMAPPLIALTDDARKRLQAIEEFSSLGSGFNIAMRDLDIRGAGNILGGEQSGFISDIGFEMYHKILDEALQELKETDYKELYKDDKPRDYVSECTLETDLEILIPDDYIEQVAERLSLYKEMTQIQEEEALQFFAIGLEDRFGKLPKPVLELIDSIRLRWIGKALAMENIRLKGDNMYAFFISNQESAFYASPQFSLILGHIQTHPECCQLREKNQKLSLRFSEIYSVKQGLEKLHKLKDALEVNVD